MNLSPAARLRKWWSRLTPHRQDRFAVIAPLAAVLLFLAAIVAAFVYLRLEEIDREQEAVKRDVEYTQQQLRLRLLERQEQLMRIAREVSVRELSVDDFPGRAEALITMHPELQALTWIDERYEVPVSPVGNGLVLRAQAYRTSLGVMGSGLFWLVMHAQRHDGLDADCQWRHTRRRMQAQQALVSETNFRRAMENSMLTGMRAMDLQGRITYVNAGVLPDDRLERIRAGGADRPVSVLARERPTTLAAILEQELTGGTPGRGLPGSVKRKDGTLFDARLYVSPLIDAVASKRAG
jgi:PAS domain-containing protein